MIIEILGTLNAVCKGSPVIIIVYRNIANKYTKIWEFSTRVGTIVSISEGTEPSWSIA